MEAKLLEKKVVELMENFGAGNHKPGSGSAAAFQGMIAAKLISTVISLTAEKKRRPTYDHCLPEFLDFQKDIEERIFPELAELFQVDSDQFDKTIKSRIARDNEKDITVKNQLRREALEELKISIEIPLKISSLCMELSEIAAYTFDNGFKAARGDSQVGLSGAVSALVGCMSIIRLNVLSFNSDEYEYTKLIVNKVNNLDIDYQRISAISDSKIKILKDEFEAKIPLFEGINNLISTYREKSGVDIDLCVRELQNLVWKNKHVIWRKNTPENLLEILRPDVILRQALGYDYFSTDPFGVESDTGETIEVAGLIDQTNKLVVVSNKFSEKVQRFTASHELGHAILHKQSIMHRDIPVDCVGQRRTRDVGEIAADKFASSFLMPEKLIKEVFNKIYSTSQFRIDEDSAFKFNGRSSSELRKECKNLRELSKKLASSESFNNQRFKSMSEMFNVSIEAMAIRIEELKLAQY